MHIGFCPEDLKLGASEGPLYGICCCSTHIRNWPAHVPLCTHSRKPQVTKCLTQNMHPQIMTLLLSHSSLLARSRTPCTPLEDCNSYRVLRYPLPLHLLQRFMPEPPQTLHASGSGIRPRKSLFRPPGAGLRSGIACMVNRITCLPECWPCSPILFGTVDEHSLITVTACLCSHCSWGRGKLLA